MTETGQIPDADAIANRLAIQDVLNKHSRGVDRADGELLKTAYWPDAEVAYGAYNGPAHPFCESLPQDQEICCNSASNNERHYRPARS